MSVYIKSCHARFVRLYNQNFKNRETAPEIILQGAPGVFRVGIRYIILISIYRYARNRRKAKGEKSSSRENSFKVDAIHGVKIKQLSPGRLKV